MYGFPEWLMIKTNKCVRHLKIIQHENTQATSVKDGPVYLYTAVKSEIIREIELNCIIFISQWYTDCTVFHVSAYCLSKKHHPAHLNWRSLPGANRLFLALGVEDTLRENFRNHE